MPRTTAATEATKQLGADRRAHDPKRLDTAKRTVLAAVRLGLLDRTLLVAEIDAAAGGGA